MILLNPKENNRSMVAIPINDTYYFIYNGKAEIIELEEKDLSIEEKNSIKKQGLKIIAGIPASYNKNKLYTRFLNESDLNKPIEETKAEIKKKKHTYEEIKAMEKPEQTKILNSFGITKIPKYEEERISAILEAEK